MTGPADVASGSGAGPRRVSGVLQLYREVVGRADAPTVREHVGAIKRHSRFPCWNVNTELGMPPGLSGFEFEAVVFHYSIFGFGLYGLDDEFRRFLHERCANSYKVAIFQDESHFCADRFEFVNEFSIDCVFSCLEDRYLETVYGTRTEASRLMSCIPGYVSEDLIDIGSRFARGDGEREIDVGYRGRTLPAYLGRSGQEKFEIGIRFSELAQSRGLQLDISCREEDRIYGDDWYRFIASCRAMLGTESGVALIDVDDKVYKEYLGLARVGNKVTVEQLEQGALGEIEGKIQYRTVGPRHFEAAALRTCQILFEGSYSGAMEPMVHYIPLRKDFSNIDEVLERFSDAGLRRTLTENAYRDLIASGTYSYASFVARFDRVLAEGGIEPVADPSIARTVDRRLQQRRRFARSYLQHWIYHRDFRARRTLESVARPIVRLARSIKDGER